MSHIRTSKIFVYIILIGILAYFSKNFANNISFSEENIFVENAALENKNLYANHIKKLEEHSYHLFGNDERFYAVNGHRITHSNKWSILAYRKHSYNKSKIDSSVYTKMTIMLPNKLDKKGKILIDNTNRKNVIYSGGGSAFPDEACFGYADNGVIEYERHNGYVTVKFNIAFNLHNSIGSDQFCSTRIRISGDFDFSQTELSKLTPWLGCKGEHIYDESFPNDEVCVNKTN